MPEKSSLALSDADLLGNEEGAVKPKRRYSNLACCCCGAWSVIVVVLVILGILAAVGYFKYYPVGYEFIDLAVGFAAKEMCSAVFVSKRDPITLYNGEYKVAGPAIEAGITLEIIQDPPSVRASDILGIHTQTCYFISNELGCQLDQGPQHVRPQYSPDPKFPFVPFDFPDATSASANKFADVDYTKLDNSVKGALDYTNNPVQVRQDGARAIAVIYKGKLVAEAYAEYLGMGQDTKLTGWSMSKSVTSAVVGLRVMDGKMDVDELMAVPQWTAEKTQNYNITLRDFLHMSSGLEWVESYALMSDVTRMLYSKPDPVSFIVSDQFPQGNKSGSYWYYSSATTNIISQAIRQSFKDEGGDKAYWSYPANRLFNQIGAKFAFETDNSGTFVGSSFTYASARDWAKFGQLYLQDGVWNGKRLLPEGWVKETITPAPASGGNYGHQWWLRPYDYKNDPNFFVDEGNDWLEVLPEGSYLCSGHDGQNVVVVPSKELVIVRLSYAPDGYDRAKWFAGLISAFPDASSTVKAPAASGAPAASSSKPAAPSTSAPTSKPAATTAPSAQPSA